MSPLQTPMVIPVFVDRADLARAWLASGRSRDSFDEKQHLTVMDLRILVKHEVPPWVQTLDMENKTMANEVGFAAWQETPWIEVKGVLWSAQEFDKEWDKESGMWKLFFKYAMKMDDGEYGALL